MVVVKHYVMDVVNACKDWVLKVKHSLHYVTKEVENTGRYSEEKY